MDLVVLKDLGSQRRMKWLILLSIFGVSSYGIYRVYNSEYIATKTKRFMKLFGSIVSFAELVIDSSETISIVSRDLKEFLDSDSDEIPNSLKQLSKITKSKEFTDSLARVSEAVAIGVFRGYNLNQESKNVEKDLSSSVVDRVFPEEGTGFVSVVVGSFAKNLVLGLYANESDDDDDDDDDDDSETRIKPRWMSLLSDDKCREVLADCIKSFTSSVVSVYIEKTVSVNTYDQIFSGLTNPKHRDSARDVLVSVCNGALETFMRTSHEVFESSKSKETNMWKSRKNREESVNGWVELLSTTLAVPSNRKFMFDVTGRVTLETMRSILEFVILKTSQSFRKSFDVIHEEVTDRGRQVVGYVGAKSSVIITFCLAVYLHIFNRCFRGYSVCLNQRF